MIIVLHFCERDWELAVLNLQLCIQMELSVPYKCLLAYDTVTSEDAYKSVSELAVRYFKEVIELKYQDPPIKKWPEGPNWAWQKTAWHMQEKIKEPWFWWEADAVPLRPGWLHQIVEAYKKSHAPFMGHIVDGMGHMNGVGVYPADVPNQCGRDIMFIRSVAWDYYGKDVIVRKCHKANHIFQHIWAIDSNRVPRWDNQHPAPSFNNWEEVADDFVDFRCSTFHRCKDGTLPRILMQHYADGATMTERNVPKHTETKKERVPEVAQVKSKPSIYNTRKKVCIFMATCERDLPWLRYSLKCIDKHTKGFHAVHIVVPEDEAPKFKECTEGMKLATFVISDKQDKNKGMLHHMCNILEADMLVPTADYFLYMDPDCMFHTPTKPVDYFTDGLPHYVIRTYDSLKSGDTVSDCFQWQAVVQKALGYLPKWYSMCRHPTIFPAHLLKPLRHAIMRHTGKDSREFILSCENKFPQTFAEFPTMGGWAISAAREHFHWIDASNGIATKDRMQNYWSHGGLDQKMRSGKTARQEIEKYLK